jgi:cyclic dehypoxanthinyl futalosine synthase
MLTQIIDKALNFQPLALEEGKQLYETLPLGELGLLAHELRIMKKKDNVVSYIIDRNVNYTNICNADCHFCAFYRPPGHEEGYVLTKEELYAKIEETLQLGGHQLLLQGGHNPDLGIEYYEDLFRDIKTRYPIKLHALGPPEIIHITQVSHLSIEETIQRLMAAGLDSIPGGGAEILVDRVRRKIAKGKCDTEEWLEVMRVAHRLGLRTTATMMFGHIETLEERLEHLIRIREVQEERGGFTAFIPWPYQSKNTILGRRFDKVTLGHEYLATLAMSRIMLNNVDNLQVSWVTMPVKVAVAGLYYGANDFGSIMIEENVVKAAGASYQMTTEQAEHHIRMAGFVPKRRNMQYEWI